ITQHYEKQINTIQHDAEPVKENKSPISLVSSRKTNPRCKKCNIRKPHYDENSNQCKDCYRASLRVLSGNKLIDDFIESTQTFYQFIPYKQFTNIEYLAKGEFSVIYKATWVDGPISRWNPKKQKYGREGNYDVALKILNNSKKMDSNYLNENNIPTIADLGISKPVDASSDENTIYGVIPYVAPEVLKGGKFTKASDIYSFGMIIPFSDRKHDEHLILDILNGLRPEIRTNTPQDLVELMERCWHSDSEKRIFKGFDGTLLMRTYYLRYELGILIDKAKRGEIKFPENKDTSILPTKINEQAIYS
ncbi:18858_t:CDS:2, partial [Racocetra fulgida]